MQWNVNGEITVFIGYTIQRTACKLHLGTGKRISQIIYNSAAYCLAVRRAAPLHCVAICHTALLCLAALQNHTLLGGLILIDYHINLGRGITLFGDFNLVLTNKQAGYITRCETAVFAVNGYFGIYGSGCEGKHTGERCGTGKFNNSSLTLNNSKCLVGTLVASLATLNIVGAGIKVSAPHTNAHLHAVDVDFHALARIQSGL